MGDCDADIYPCAKFHYYSIMGRCCHICELLIKCLLGYFLCQKLFNVSALLLDDALKPATPLTNGAINETL